MTPIFLIYGPSGVGQDSVIKGLKKKMRFNRVITTVTRPMRAGERQGKPYYFISQKKFKSLLAQKRFIEWAKVYGDLRGCTKDEIERLLKKNIPILWKVDWQGAVAIKKLYPHAVAILIAPESLAILRHRLEHRGLDSHATIKKRLTGNLYWMKRPQFYDYKIVNKEDRLHETVKKAHEIIKKTMAKSHR